MKKIIILILAVMAAAFIFTGCAKNAYENNISEIRDDVFIGETEHFEVIGFIGKRENPYRADGAANNMVPYFLVAISPKFETNEDDIMYANIILKDKMYSKSLTKNVLHNKFIYDFADLKPDENFTINVAVQAYDEDVTMTELFQGGMKTYQEALKEGMALLKDKFEDTKDGNKYACEIYVRLTYSKFMTDEKLYWYVGLLDTKGNTEGVIIDIDK